MARAKAPPVVDLDKQAVEQMLGRVQAVLTASDFDLVKHLVEVVVYLITLVRTGRSTIARLRRLFGLPREDKQAAKPNAHTRTGDGQETSAGADEAKGGEKPAGEKGEKPKRKTVKGHGRLPVSAYVEATHIHVPHETLHAGDRCPCGCGGKLYLVPPAPYLRLFGQAPLQATCWDCEQLRSSTCGKVYKAQPPQEARGEKFDATAGAMIALLCYGINTPFDRLAGLQAALGIPVPTSTLWEVVESRTGVFRPVHEKLVWIGAQGSVFYGDDSYTRVLEYMGKRRAALLAKDEAARTKAEKAKAEGFKAEPVKIELPDPTRTGLFTTAIVSTADEERPPVVLFFTGRKHAGENLAALLSKRCPTLDLPILMSDALSRNAPKGHEFIWCNCLAHGLRKIEDECDNYPAECQFILDQLSHVYAVDRKCKEQGLSANERLKVHQEQSTQAMDEMFAYMTELLDNKLVEANSDFGQALNYFLKRWDNFLRFLSVAGAPLDNNTCERALKMAIGHRNGSLFYRNLHGAEVGDLYMTIIYTTVLAGENPFTYLTALQRHEKDVAENPDAWLPWTYRDTLAKLGEPVSPPPVPKRSRPVAAARARASPASSADDLTQPKAA